MFYIFQGGKQDIKFATVLAIVVEFVILSEWDNNNLVFDSAIRFHTKVYVIIACWEDI